LASQDRHSESQLHACPSCGAELSQHGFANGDHSLRVRIASGNDHLDRADATALDRKRAISDLEQTLSDRDQTMSDRDQAASDRDQAAEDRDEQASAGDQEASDRELAAGGDPVEHELNKVSRDRASAERVVAAESRDSAAEERDLIAHDRDQTTNTRDRLNAAEDVSLRDALGGGSAYLQAKAVRARAAADRIATAINRERAARDRETAAALRAAAARDRAEAVQERALAGIDQLTGVKLRGLGLTEIEHEIQRSRRTGRRLTLAFVDVNYLKAVNDNQGHLAGDALLHQVAETLQKKLRPYDVIVRFGGDEFLCALANMDAREVHRRFNDIIETLEAAGLSSPISFGVAELESEDDLVTLLARADNALIEARRSSGHRSEWA
jgi:diguanylate cyclase (GGDEF)-like protein